MKRKLLSKQLKRAAIAVPAAAMMLGAAQAGTTIGLNFQAWYYDSGATPQTIGFGSGYQTTGVPVTTKAFGVEVANWYNSDPLDCNAAFVATVPFGGSLTATVRAANMWQSGFTAPGLWGTTAGNWSAAVWPPGAEVLAAIQPGDYQVTWGMVDNTGWNMDITGLSAKFPNGYVLTLIGAGKTTANSRVAITNLANSAGLADVSFTVLPDAMGLGSTPVLTADSINLFNDSRPNNRNVALGGVIITDQPVVTRKPLNTSVNQGAALNLSAGAVGIAPLSYQWRLNGVAIPNATDSTYTVPSATLANGGSYDLVVTNLYGAGTSVAATVTVVAVPSIVKDLGGVTGTVYSGGKFSLWSVVAAGGEPLHYTWLKNGSTKVGADSPTLTLDPVAVADSGSYAVLVTNIYGTAKSATNQLVVVAAPNTYATAVAQDSPSAYWPLNETSGTDALDYSGAARIGTNGGGITLGATGPRPPTYAGFQASKTAYQFDGGSSFIEFGTGPSLSGTGDFTVEAWISTTAAAAGTIIQQRDPLGYNGEYMFGVNADGTLFFTVYGGGQQFSFSSTKKVNDGNWHHVAAVRTATSGTIYIDGSAAATVTSTYLAPLDGTIKTYIGADKRDGVSYFNGSISDVAIYTKALASSRIAYHAYVGSLGNAPITLSVVPGGFIDDTKPVGVRYPGNNNSVLWTASATDAAPTPVTRTGVAVFNGGSQIATPAADAFNTTSGTIAFWMRADAPIPGPGNEGAMLFDRRTTNGVCIILKDSGAIFWQGSGGRRNSFETGYLPDNNWHHVAITYGQNVDDLLLCYIDGALSSTTTVTNGWTWPPTQQIEIGKSHDGYWKKFNGQMDDFRMYKRVLTETEITQVFTTGALVDTTALVLRYDFTTSGVGSSLTWQSGPLLSSPTLGPSAVWTPVPNAAPPYPFLPPPPSNPAGPSLFYRVAF